MLRARKPEVVRKRLKFFMFGPAGVGKTTAAIQFPNSYIIDCERGTENYDKLVTESGSAVYQTTDINEVIAEVKALLTEPHDFRTLVIDPITTVYNDLLEKLNQIFLMGNVTRDPQMRQTPNQSSVTNFGLAVNRHYKAADGTDKEETCFIDCVAFGKTADTLARYLRKGKPLLVQGRLKFDVWDDPNGAKRTRHSVIVEHFQFVGARDGSGGLDGFMARRETQTELFSNPDPRSDGGAHDSASFDESEIPF